MYGFKVGDKVRMTAAYLATLAPDDRSSCAGVYTVTHVRGELVLFVNDAGDETGCAADWLEIAD